MTQATNLSERLRAFHKKHGRNISISAMTEFVVEAVNAAVAETNSKDQRLQEELSDLAEYIAEAKSDIASLSPHDVKTDLLPSASDELDAIVEATETATHEIMAATEAIDEVAESLVDELSMRLGNETIRIYQACGFQDITGQRIGKVVQTLHHIDVRVDALLAAFGEPPVDSAVSQQAPKNSKEAMSDADLLEGPQLSDKAIKQDEVDALLASFD